MIAIVHVPTVAKQLSVTVASGEMSQQADRAPKTLIFVD